MGRHWVGQWSIACIMAAAGVHEQLCPPCGMTKSVRPPLQSRRPFRGVCGGLLCRAAAPAHARGRPIAGAGPAGPTHRLVRSGGRGSGGLVSGRAGCATTRFVSSDYVRSSAPSFPLTHPTSGGSRCWAWCWPYRVPLSQRARPRLTRRRPWQRWWPTPTTCPVTGADGAPS